MRFFRILWRGRPPPALALGQVVVTPAASMALAQADVTPDQLLRRHAAGDWGDIDALDLRQNVLGLRLGLRVRSAYTLARLTGDASACVNPASNPVAPPAAVACWVVTTPNRKTTTILLPSEIFDEAGDDHE